MKAKVKSTCGSGWTRCTAVSLLVLVAVCPVLVATGETGTLLRYESAPEGTSYLVTQEHGAELQEKRLHCLTTIVLQLQPPPKSAAEQAPTQQRAERRLLSSEGDTELSGRWDVSFFAGRKAFGAPTQNENESLDADALIRQFDALPFLPKDAVAVGAEWTERLRVRFREARYAVLVEITQRLERIDEANGRKIAIIAYSASANLDTAKHPEMLATDADRAAPPRFTVSISGNMRLDVSAGIVLKKEQTAEWSEFAGPTPVGNEPATGSDRATHTWRCLTRAWLLSIPAADVDKMIELAEQAQQKSAKDVEPSKSTNPPVP